MQFNIYGRHDGAILAVPTVIAPAAFLSLSPAPELIGQVRCEPSSVPHDVLVAIGLHGYAELAEGDLDALCGQQLPQAISDAGKIPRAGAEASD
ncbi:hypothetical protein [Lysobacter sp. HA18]